jgi:hypothetical protein
MDVLMSLRTGTCGSDEAVPTKNLPEFGITEL